jgi:integrase
MATLSYIKGRSIVQFPKTGERGRHTLYLGKMSRKDATTIRSHIDNIIAHNIHRQSLPRETAAWIADIADDLHGKLSGMKLVTPRQEHSITAIGPFIDRYIAGRTDLKPRTVLNLKQVQSGLVEFFGKDRDLKTITRGDMGDWHRKMKSRYATATVAMHVKKARQFFADAVDRELVDETPLKGIKAGSMANADRQEYVAVADLLKVIEACPDAEWKLIFALARFGGVRVPSETDELLWTDVRWGEGRMTIRSPKTEHHKGGDKREIPIFPELLPYLRDAFEQSDGNRHAVMLHRGANPRRMADKIVERSGVKAWVKIFQNLRSSRETDLASVFPLHVVCAWIGNSESVARKHYLQVTDEHFRAGAAKSAVDRTDTYRTQTGQQNKNPHKTEGFSETEYPQGESFDRQKIAKSLGSGRRALQKALRLVKVRAARMRKSDIVRLSRAVQRVAHRPSGKAGAA